MKKSQLKKLIKEEIKSTLKEEDLDNWTEGDVNVVNRQLQLCIKQANGLDYNYKKLMNLLEKSENKPQGYQLWKLTKQLPIKGLIAFKNSLIDLGSKLKMVFPKNW